MSVRARDSHRTARVSAAEPRPAVAIIGAGRAGSALAVGLTEAGYRIAAVHSRTPAHAERLAALVGAKAAATPLDAVRSAGIALLTVPDREITAVAATMAATGMALPGRTLIHCCASRGREALSAARRTTAGVAALHPLQALNGAESAGLLRGSLFALDADPAVEPAVTRIVEDLGGVAVQVDAAMRPAYHAAAVLAGNAPLALLAEAAELLAASGMDREAATQGLAHLLTGALANARRSDPSTALTGPVVRGDAVTVRSHLRALDSHPVAFDLYVSTARAILDILGSDTRSEVATALDTAQPAAQDLRHSGRTAA